MKLLHAIEGKARETSERIFLAEMSDLYGSRMPAGEALA